MKSGIALPAFAFAIVVGLLGALSIAAQQPSEGGSSADSRSDAISGRVVNENGQPIANATVVVRALGSQGQGANAVTDAEGRFRVDGLEAKAYQVYSSVAGYTPPARNPANTLVPYYRVGDSVDLRMVKGGVITGTVITATGDPVVAIPVNAYLTRDGNGQPPRYGGRARQQLTDDRGAYRIYGLPAGTYVVAAGGSGNVYGSNMPNAYETEQLVYASSSVRSTAREITVVAGEESSSVDIRYHGEPGFRISGSARIASIATDPGSALQPYMTSITLSAIPTGNAQEDIVKFEAFNTPEFVLYGVADGDYLLTAQSYLVGDSRISESRRVKVRGSDLGGIELIVKPFGSMAGRVVLEGSRAPECKDKSRPSLAETVITPWHNEKDNKSQPPFLWATGGPSTPDKEGMFTLRSLAPSQYRLNVKFFAKYWYLRSITLPTSPLSGKTRAPERLSNASQNWLPVKLGDRVSGLVVTLAEGAASFQGKLKIPEGQDRAAQSYVFLFPSERDDADNVLRFFVASAPDGTFVINNVPPGRYWAIARKVADSDPDPQTKLRLPDQNEARAKLRQESTVAKTEIELKPCQNLTNFSLPFVP